MDETRGLEPILNADEASEWNALAYFLVRLESMRQRDLITADAYESVRDEAEDRRRAIERSGRFQAAMAVARANAETDPAVAIEWSLRARGIDPSRAEAESLVAVLRRRLAEVEVEVEARAREADGSQTEAFAAPGTGVGQSGAIPAGKSEPQELAEARLALRAGDDSRVILLCTKLLDRQPGRVDALAHRAFARRRLGRVREALEDYRRLHHLEPGVDSWSQWVRALETKPRPGPPVPSSEPVVAVTSLVVDSASPARPSWARITGEFLEEHWQKLILSLALLLIVVSSTVGAHLLLGPRLWSPVGKCTLALVYTLLFAAFGGGLTRWGADRAGRMMLVATLIVVPINFMLTGEMRLLTDPSPSRLAVLVLDAAALLALSWRVLRVLGIGRGSGGLAVSLCVLSAFDAGTASGVPFALGFAAFLSPCAVFLAAIWRLGARSPGDGEPEPHEFAYLTLGLLGFALISGLIRAGVVLPLPSPSLYSLPASIIAIACVHTASHLRRFEKDATRIATVRLGGLWLSGLALALALARPPGASPLYSGNTLATAFVALALYVALLVAERHPAYLYLAFGAMFLSYFGVFYFVKDLVHSVEEAARKALGYGTPLPFAFKSINGLVFNTGLALLALRFSRRWGDDRLARHCHFIGIPLAVAACLLSGLEPKAAVICLSGYAILAVLASWVFEAPTVLYLACATSAGACLFGSLLIPSLSLESRALGVSILGSVFWAAGRATRRLNGGADRSYGLPLVHSALIAAVLATVASTSAAFQGIPIGIGSVVALLAAGSLSALLVEEESHPLVAHMATLGMLGAWLCGVTVANHGLALSTASYGVAVALFTLGMLGLAERARTWMTRRAAVFAHALPDAVPLLVLLAVLLSAVGLGGDWLPVAFAFAVASVALIWLTRFRRRVVPVRTGLAMAVASVYVTVAGGRGWGHGGADLAALALATAASALAAWGAAEWSRRRGISDLYRGPALEATYVLLALVFAITLAARVEAREAYPLAALALLGDALVFFLLTTSNPAPRWTYLSVLSVASATALTLLSVATPDPSRAYVLGLASVVEALACWGLGLACRRLRRNDDGPRVYGRPLSIAAVVLNCLAGPLASDSPWTLLLVGVAFLLLVKSFPATGWLYAAGVTFGLALRDIFRAHPIFQDGILGMTLAAFGLWTLAIAARRWGPRLVDRFRLPPLAFEVPLFRMAVASASFAAILRSHLTYTGALPWTAAPWVPLTLACFCLLMLEAFCAVGWVVLAVVLTSMTTAMLIAPRFVGDAARLAWLSGLAVGWLLVARGLRRLVPMLERRYPDIVLDSVGMIAGWSRLHFGVASVLLTMTVLATTLASVFGQPFGLSLAGRGDWGTVSLALGLAASFVASSIDERRDLEGKLLLGFGILILVVWWVGAPSSPIPHLLRFDRDAYFPLATVALAVAVTPSTRRLGRRNSAIGSGGDVLPSDRLGGWLSNGGVALSLIAIAFTRGLPGATTVCTLLAGAFVLGVLTVTRGRVDAAYCGGLSWSAACVYLGIEASRGGWFGAHAASSLVLTLGNVAAMATLGSWRFVPWATRLPSQPVREPMAGSIARAFERIALLDALIATAALAWFAAFDPVDRGGAIAGAVAMLAVALYEAELARRWAAEWLVYAAQASLVGAYLSYRTAFPLSAAADAAILSLMGYVDLGLAEVLERLQVRTFARPTFSMALILPLLPLGEAAFEGRLDQVNLVLLFTTATFYGVACYSRRWKPLGYAAAILFNALLWLAWSRVGWRFADHPQFFLVPVGFSTILFAEANRGELGRKVVDGVRLLGLVVIDASLALPIWQVQSFGAWLTLLLISLAGVFVGIGLRIQTFVWLGLVGFVLDVVYQLGRMGTESPLAKWGIMLSLGIFLILFVALNEKKRIVATLRDCVEQVRGWD